VARPRASGENDPPVVLAPAATVELVYGDGGVAIDDPAELFHEASKYHPSTVGRQTRGYLLGTSTEIRASWPCSGKPRFHLPAVELPEPACLDVSLGAAIRARRSTRAFADAPLSLVELATLLDAAYGITGSAVPAGDAGGPLLRSVPSGGGLYPLELDVLAWRVSGLRAGRYHFDPFRRVLEVIRVGALEDEVRSAAVYAEPATACGALVVVSAMFWRTRFKYGLRGYRFALMEAGHVVQNLLLSATALGLGSVPLGGYFDRRFDELLDLDGVNESTLYTVAVGRYPTAERAPARD